MQLQDWTGWYLFLEKSNLFMSYNFLIFIYFDSTKMKLSSSGLPVRSQQPPARLTKTTPVVLAATKWLHHNINNWFPPKWTSHLFLKMEEEEERWVKTCISLKTFWKRKKTNSCLFFLKSLLSVFLSIPTHRSFFFVVIDSRLTYYLSSRNTCCPLFVCTLSKNWLRPSVCINFSIDFPTWFAYPSPIISPFKKYSARSNAKWKKSTISQVLNLF